MQTGLTIRQTACLVLLIILIVQISSSLHLIDSHRSIHSLLKPLILRHSDIIVFPQGSEAQESRIKYIVVAIMPPISALIYSKQVLSK